MLVHIHLKGNRLNVRRVAQFDKRLWSRWTEYIERILHEWAFHMKFMKRTFGEF